MENLPDWFVAARSRLVAARPKPEVMDTPEKADAEGVPLGTSVLRYAPPAFIPDAQQALDNWQASEILRQNPNLWV